MTDIEKCEVCGSTALIPVLDLGMQPLTDDLVEIGGSHECKKYPIEIVFCDFCKTAHQRHQVPKQTIFHPEYHYRAKQTNDVLDGMRQFADSVEKHGLVRGLKVLDVGCNDGSLLDIFQDRCAVTFGVDPIEAVWEAQTRHTVYKKFFCYQWASEFFNKHGAPDLITFTNVFAHIEDLDDVIDALNVIKHAGTRIVIENHYLGSVLYRHQFDTFYHEHPRTYSYTSFVHIAARLGMYIEWVEFPERYGGNIRVILAPGEAHPGNPRYMHPERDFRKRMEANGEQVKHWRRNKRAELRPYERFSCAAFPARASVLINLLGLDTSSVEAVFEKTGSKKIGYYVPGTRIPIKDDDQAIKFFSHDDIVLNLAWHIPHEIEARWRANGFKGRFIQAISEEDFQ